MMFLHGFVLVFVFVIAIILSSLKIKLKITFNDLEFEIISINFLHLDWKEAAKTH